MERRVLIVGLGIAGMASAIALKKAGWTPVVVERAPRRRTGGYFIGLHPAGKDAAEKLGVMEKIHIRTPLNSHNWHMTKDGSRVRVAGFADQPTRPATMLRGDVEEALWETVQDWLDVRYSTVPIAIEDRAEAVTVSLRTGESEPTEETFDLVVGADGLRSSVRKLVFGPHEQFMHSLGAIICAYQLRNEIETFKARDGIILNQDRRSLWIFPFEDHTQTALFTYRTDDIDAQFRRPPVETLRDVYAGMDPTGIVDEALGDLEKADSYLFDSVHEVRMDHWSKGRVVLVGDAAWCLTLYSGMGATAALVGGQQLGECLPAAGDGNVHTMLKAWEKGMRPFIEKQRRGVRLKSQLFVPSNGFFFVLRRIVLRLGGQYLARLSQQHGVPKAA